MAGLLDSYLNIGANALAAAAPFLGLATADPGVNGGNATSAPRRPAGWAQAVNGDVSIGAPVSFAGGASNGPVTHVTLWSAQTGGTFRGSLAIPPGSDLSFNAAGNYSVDALTLAG